jgi:hypothetical protein
MSEPSLGDLLKASILDRSETSPAEEPRADLARDATDSAGDAPTQELSPSAVDRLLEELVKAPDREQRLQAWARMLDAKRNVDPEQVAALEAARLERCHRTAS